MTWLEPVIKRLWSLELPFNLVRVLLIEIAVLTVMGDLLGQNYLGFWLIETECNQIKEIISLCLNALQNWENQIASQMYTLIWTDFFVHVFTLLVVNTIKK